MEAVCWQKHSIEELKETKSGKKETTNRGDCTTLRKHVFESQETNCCRCLVEIL